MNKQNRTSNLSFILLLVVILGCLGWLWQADDHAPQVSYAQVRQLFLQEKVKTFDIDTDHTLTLTLREPVDGNSEVRYKLYDFQLFYDDLNDLVQQQYADGIITDYDYPDPEPTNWLEVLLPWVLTALTTAGAGLGIPLSGALPMYYLSRRLSRSGCAAAGYAGAKAVSRPRRLVLTDDDLFPVGTVTLNGYKVFGEERSRAVSYAASVARAAGSSLTPLLERQLTAEGGFHLSVEWVNYCEEGGVEANIRGETVLMGSAYFMKKRKVALPRDMKLSTGVFLAVDGALTAVFAVKYQPSRNAEWALRTLKRFHIVPVLAVRSGNVTPGLIKRKFGVDAKPVYPDVSTRLALAQLAEQQGEQPCVAICREGLMPLVESVAGSRRAVKAVRTATILSYIGAAAGVALAYYLTSVGNFALLTPIAMVLYQVLWLLPTLLLAGLVKHY